MTHTPTAFNQVIGNVAAIERIKREIEKRSGLGGCFFFLQGESGTGKSMLADILASMADCDTPYQPTNPDDPDCIEKLLLHLKEHGRTPAMTWLFVWLMVKFSSASLWSSAVRLLFLALCVGSLRFRVVLFRVRLFHWECESGCWSLEFALRRLFP